MELTSVQTKLAADGLYEGAIDGKMGFLTMSGLLCAAASARTTTATITAISPALVSILQTAELTTPLRICHFIAQATEETADWSSLVEEGGPTYFQQYDGRFGNDEDGDGYKYRGRGPLMLTFKSNYAQFGEAIGVDLVTYPDRILSDPNVAAQVAGAFWTQRGCNRWADVDNLPRITQLINGGLNGLLARQENLRRLKALWGL